MGKINFLDPTWSAYQGWGKCRSTDSQHYHEEREIQGIYIHSDARLW